MIVSRLDAAARSGRVIKRLDPEQCRARLRTAAIGRVVFVRHGRPLVLPVTYALDEERGIVFRTTRGSKLWVAHNEPGQRVAFQVDGLQADGSGWWVTVHGPMEGVLGRLERTRLSHLGVEPWADDLRRDDWVRIAPERVEGWRA